jgi:hypothetical protein
VRQAAGNLPNVRKSFIVIRSLTPQQAARNALAVHFHSKCIHAAIITVPSPLWFWQVMLILRTTK